MTKEKIITNVLKEQKIINYQTYFANAMSVAMGIYADQETSALRAENERLREEVRVLTETVNIQHGLMTDAEQRGIVKGESENAALRQQVKDMGEVIKELNGRIINLQSADMTHEYNQAEAQRVWPQIEQQIRDDEREKTLAQFGITTGPENS